MRIAVIALALTGCTTVEYRDRVVYETVEVSVPVPCVESVPERVDLERPGDTDFENIRAIVIDRDNLLTQQERLRAMLAACRGN